MDVYNIDSEQVADAAGMIHLTDILQSLTERPLVLIVSAMGSTTLTLEAIAASYFAGNRADALAAFQTLFDWHVDQVRSLLGSRGDQAISHLDEFRTEVEWLLHDRPVRPFDYYFDQIVCAGVLMSSAILAATLKEKGVSVQWMDVRDIIRTDDQFRMAEIDVSFSQQKINRLIRPALASNNIVVTQGSIGSTDENESTTFGMDDLEKTAKLMADYLATTVKQL